MAQENTNHHRMGEIYNYIVEKKLAERAGFKDAKDFFSQHLADLSQSTLSMYGAVAEAFTEPVTRRFGVTCLYLLLTLQGGGRPRARTTSSRATRSSRCRTTRGRCPPCPSRACSVEQMRRALQRKRKPSSSKPLPPEAEALAEQYREAVTRPLPQGKGTRVKVAVRNQKGKAVLDFKGIPVEQVHLLTQALTNTQHAVPKPAKTPEA